MALTVTNVLALTASASTFGTGAYSPAAITVVSGQRLVVRLMAMSEADDALAGTDLTISDSQGLTWTPLIGTTSSDSPGWGYASRIWRSSATTGTSITLTFDAGAFNVHRYLVIVDQLSGDDTASSATASGTDADGQGSASITLSGTPASSSVILALVQRADTTGTSGTVTAGTGWTDEGQTKEDAWGGWQVQRRTGYTGTSVDWNALNSGTNGIGAQMLAVEIKDASGGAPTITTQPEQQTASSGGTATFSVSATGGTAPYSYQWQSAPITDLLSNVPGAWSNVGTNSSSYTTGTLSSADNGKWYRVTITDNVSQTVTSSAVRLFIRGLGDTGLATADSPPGITGWLTGAKAGRKSLRPNPSYKAVAGLRVSSTDDIQKTIFTDWIFTSSTSGVTGTLSVTTQNDTLAASGTTTIVGSLTRTNSNDTISATGTTTIVGTLSRTNANDTLAASGTVGSSVTGTLSVTTANDTSSGTGTTTIVGTLSRTSINDTSTASGSPVIVGTLAKTINNDTLNGSGTTTIIGSISYTNINDSISASGNVGSSVSGTLSYTNINDSLSSSGTTTIVGTLAITSRNDTLSAFGASGSGGGSVSTRLPLTGAGVS